MGYLKDEILEKVATSEDNIIFEEAVYSISSFYLVTYILNVDFGEKAKDMFLH